MAGQAYRCDRVPRAAEYRVSDEWTRQYDDRPLDGDLDLKRAIRPIAGATLTAVATNQAVRRVLAIDRVLESEHR